MVATVTPAAEPPALGFTEQEVPEFGYVELHSNTRFGVQLSGMATKATLAKLIDPVQAPLLYAIVSELLGDRNNTEYAFPFVFIDCGKDPQQPDMVSVMPPTYMVQRRLAARVARAAASVGYDTTDVSYMQSE